MAPDKAEADRLFREAVESGADPVEIIAAAKLFAVDVRANRALFIPAATWLRGRRWEDYAVEITADVERGPQS
jgi:hypothetical protein